MLFNFIKKLHLSWFWGTWRCKFFWVVNFSLKFTNFIKLNKIEIIGGVLNILLYILTQSLPELLNIMLPKLQWNKHLIIRRVALHFFKIYTAWILIKVEDLYSIVNIATCRTNGGFKGYSCQRTLYVEGSVGD